MSWLPRGCVDCVAGWCCGCCRGAAPPRFRALNGLRNGIRRRWAERISAGQLHLRNRNLRLRNLDSETVATSCHDALLPSGAFGVLSVNLRYLLGGRGSVALILASDGTTTPHWDKLGEEMPAPAEIANAGDVVSQP